VIILSFSQKERITVRQLADTTDDAQKTEAGNKNLLRLCLARTIKKNPSTKGGRTSRAKDRARTGHPDLGKVVLYQMSYFRLCQNELLICCHFAGTGVPASVFLKNYGVAKIGHVPFLKKFYSNLFVLGSI
jgi:hypothetical protein